jgi:hypothetical protein
VTRWLRAARQDTSTRLAGIASRGLRAGIADPDGLRGVLGEIEDAGRQLGADI